MVVCEDTADMTIEPEEPHPEVSNLAASVTEKKEINDGSAVADAQPLLTSTEPSETKGEWLLHETRITHAMTAT